MGQKLKTITRLQCFICCVSKRKLSIKICFAVLLLYGRLHVIYSLYYRFKITIHQYFFLCLKDKEMEEACTVMNNLMKIQIHLLDCLLFLKGRTSGIAGAKWQCPLHTTDLLVVLGSRQPPQALLSIVLLHVSCY